VTLYAPDDVAREPIVVLVALLLSGAAVELTSSQLVAAAAAIKHERFTIDSSQSLGSGVWRVSIARRSEPSP
jgi:hypothetical protein